MMQRFLCIYFPEWPIQAARKKILNRERPLILTDQNAGQVVVRSCCEASEKSGVRPGMSAALARALCPEATLHPFEGQLCFKMLYKLALWAFRFSPLVAIDRELVQAYRNNTLQEIDSRFYGLILDITGTERVHRGEFALLERILFKAQKAGLLARVAIAPTSGAAWALSRYGGPSTRGATQVGEGKNYGLICRESREGIFQVVDDLPVAALKISGQALEQLEELGVRTIYDLRMLPRKELPTRFGARLVSQLDQLVGASQEPLMLVHPRKHTVVSKEFDPPLSIQRGVHKAILELTIEILQKLNQQKKRARQFTMTIQGIDPWQPVAHSAFCIRKEFSLHAATRDLTHISSIITPFFETLTVPEGVMRLTLAAQNIEEQWAEQQDYDSSLPGRVSQQQQEEFLNTALLQLGRENVLQATLHESHIPERAFAYAPLDRSENSLRSKRHGRLRYPSCILKSPQPISALSLLPDAPPTRVTWQGQHLKILQGFGPERTSEEWWQNAIGETQAEREYFRVQDEHGRWLWVFRKRESLEWFLHGVWA